jgi:hypothetical protein
MHGEIVHAQAMARRKDIAPHIDPRGLSRDEAASYVGIGTTLFDSWIKGLEARGRKIIYRIGACVRYDRRRLDAAIEEMFDAVDAAGDDAYAPERQAA